MSSDAIKSVIDNDAGVLKASLTTQATSDGQGVITAGYLDDYIEKGNVHNIGLAQSFTADTPIYFTTEPSDPSTITRLYLLPISITPTAGYATLNIYEDTEYTGGTVVQSANRNRYYSDDLDTVILVGATGTVKGNILPFTTVSGVVGTNQSAGGGSNKTSNAIILDVSKRYLYELTCTETAIVGINSEFVEI